MPKLIVRWRIAGGVFGFIENFGTLTAKNLKKGIQKPSRPEDYFDLLQDGGGILEKKSNRIGACN